MRLYELKILNETYENLFIRDREKREQFADQVWDILQQSYAPIGGIKGGGFESKEAMIEKIPMWKLNRRGDEVKTVSMYKDKSGRKRVAVGTDGSKEAKIALANQMKAELLGGKSFAEISGPSLKFIKRSLGDAFESILVPFEQVKEVLKDDYEAGNIEQVDEYNYKRNINGNWIGKVMVGTPNVAMY